MSLLSRVIDRKHKVESRSLYSVTMGNFYSGQIRNELILMPADNPCLVSPALGKHDLTKANLFVPVCLSRSRSPWVCVGCCVRAETHPSPMSLCAHTHTHGASTHALGAHAPTAGTDAVNWTLGARRSPAEPSGAESSPLGAWGCQQRQSYSQRSGPAALDGTPGGKVSKWPTFAQDSNYSKQSNLFFLLGSWL